MSRTEITTPEALPEETSTEISLRPSRLSEFVGQATVKENLQIAIDAARQRGEPLDHILFFGPPGLGKTTLAALLAHADTDDILKTVDYSFGHDEISQTTQAYDAQGRITKLLTDEIAQPLRLQGQYFDLVRGKLDVHPEWLESIKE